MQDNLTIISASAGSGKTHTLTQRFLGWLTQRAPGQQGDLLAVTFTNKAAAEMKDRIVDTLAQSGRRDYLTAVLHGWDDLRISTIDTFLQQLSRAVAPQLGIAPGCRVELDEDTILRQTTDRILEDTATDEDLAVRLLDLSLDQIRQGRSWSLDATLREAAARFMDEPLALRLLDHGSAITDKGAVDAMAKTAEGAIKAFEESLRKAGRDGMDAMAAMGRQPEDYKGKSRSPMCVFRAWADGVVKEPPARLGEMYGDAEEPVARALTAALQLFDTPYREYRTSLLMRETLPTAALYGQIMQRLEAVLRDNDATLLRRSGEALARLTLNGTTAAPDRSDLHPEVLLIDEAQDTSSLQWRNLEPLAADAIRRDGNVLAVGDMKQSIYRWRGSDWRILDGLLEQNLPVQPKKETLTTNWRSGEAIVTFNNILFSNAEGVARNYNAAMAADRIHKVYEDVIQNTPAPKDIFDTKAADGKVTLRFLEMEDWKKKALDAAVDDIMDLRREGYPWNAITILVRRSSDGKAVTRHLVENQVPVVTDDSLAAGSNAAVSRMATALRLMCHDDALTRLEAEQTGAPTDLHPEGSLYETVAALVPHVAAQPSDMPFIQVMLDAALEWQRDKGSQLRPFIEWWDEKGRTRNVSGAATDAVTVMTIHKSKGLSLDAVIIPFAAEGFTPPPMLTPTIWCEAKGPYAPLGLVPLKAHESKLRGTDFEAEWQEENTRQHLDTLNLLYVACTRAKKRLFLYCPSGSRWRYLTTDAMLRDIFMPYAVNGTYTMGQGLPRVQKEDNAATLALPPAKGHRQGDKRIRLRLAEEEEG